MRKIVLVDNNESFRNVVELNMMINEDTDLELVDILSDVDLLNSSVEQYTPDIILISDNVIEQFHMRAYGGAKIYGYETGEGETEVFAQKGIPTYGEIDNAEELIRLVANSEPKLVANSEQSNFDEMKSQVKEEVPFIEEDSVTEELPIVNEVPQIDNSINNDSSNAKPSLAESLHNINTSSNTSTNNSENINNNFKNTTAVSRETNTTVNTSQSIESNNASDESYRSNSQIDSTKSNDREIMNRGVSTFKERINQQRQKQIAEETESFLKTKYEETNKPKRAKVVTVYAAKGGVGKTTISTELSAYLSMTSVGRKDNLKVCIVDYNIDFGDVLPTLNFSPDGPIMTEWAQEIKERINNGENASDIVYSQNEIEQRLQKHSSFVNLYSLVAPLSHPDSMYIGETELSVMLSNIVNNGGFDFVVCDTGNNTRDSSITALDIADYILLVATQDITTVNCNLSFLSTIEKVEPKMLDKMYLILNNIMPFKYTQIAVDELEKEFNFKCLARIKHSADVVKANNCSQPIVLNSNHEFTRELSNVVRFLVGEPPTIAKKKSIFDIFRRR